MPSNHAAAAFPRASGILLPVSSLPSPYGIGTLGAEAYRWVDFLHTAKQTYWQVLPLNPLGFGFSPYQSPSAFAGEPYFIDLDVLIAEGLLQKDEVCSIDWGADTDYVDYARLQTEREPVLRRACARFVPGEDYDAFLKQHAHWIMDYALYMAIGKVYAPLSWAEWPAPLRLYEYGALNEFYAAHTQEVDYYLFLQYQFFKQWAALKAYANQKRIQIIGDIPIYVAMESADVWAHRELFLLNEHGVPTALAGVPPDYFSADGQLWNNPLYRWDVLKQTGYRWWVNRLHMSFLLYDVVRIDHFRGLESYYCVPAGSQNAREGVWRPGPGMELIAAIRHALPNCVMIAEDLGVSTPALKALLQESGLPGMRVLAFAFDSDEKNEHLPHHHPHNAVVYTGTHDNDTLRGFLESAPLSTLRFAQRYCHAKSLPRLHQRIISLALRSAAHTAIVPLQDYLFLGSEARMNTPATVFENNWRWRARRSNFSSRLAKKIAKATEAAGRVPPADC
ncbi:4-alpha-glucanotransferase [Christensenellaceae bacterium OttesenSCG-928-L17]|nr:4-alpha-glucanotransferase [Christensenellaceae bacterium OttesenSCG-928-L17]